MRCSLHLIHFPLRLHFCVAAHFSHGVLDRALSFVGGAFDVETISGSIARFERDVPAYGPDLVVWQLGTNDVAWGGRADGDAKHGLEVSPRCVVRCSLHLIHFPLRLHFCVAAHFSHGVLDRALSFVGGAFDVETISGSIARFERDVPAYGPDLVVWQLGTNDVAWGGRADGARDRVVAGVRRLKAAPAPT